MVSFTGSDSCPGSRPASKPTTAGPTRPTPPSPASAPTRPETKPRDSFGPFKYDATPPQATQTIPSQPNARAGSSATVGRVHGHRHPVRHRDLRERRLRRPRKVDASCQRHLPRQGRKPKPRRAASAPQVRRDEAAGHERDAFPPAECERLVQRPADVSFAGSDALSGIATCDASPTTPAPTRPTHRHRRLHRQGRKPNSASSFGPSSTTHEAAGRRA